MVKYNRPFSDYQWLNQLDKAKGLDVGDSTYSKQKAGVKFLEFIAQTERDKLVTLVANSHFFSLAMDGRSDVATIEQETLFLKTCYQGKLHVNFLCVEQPESTASDDLYEFVMNQLKSNQIYEHMTKFIGMVFF